MTRRNQPPSQSPFQPPHARAFPNNDLVPDTHTTPNNGDPNRMVFYTRVEVPTFSPPRQVAHNIERHNEDEVYEETKRRKMADTTNLGDWSTLSSNASGPEITGSRSPLPGTLKSVMSAIDCISCAENLARCDRRMPCSWCIEFCGLRSCVYPVPYPCSTHKRMSRNMCNNG